jgi:hypothetical protein
MYSGIHARSLENKEIEISYIPTAEMTADILTKSLNQVKHEIHARGLGLRPIESSIEEISQAPIRCALSSHGV